MPASVTLTFDLLTTGQRIPSDCCMSTELGVDSSSRFHFKARTRQHARTDRQTDRHTEATDHPTHSSATASMSNTAFIHS